MNPEVSVENPPPNLVDLLDQLVLPTEPAPISMMPQTVGWILLGVLVLAAMFFGLYRAVLQHRAHAYRRDALNELASAGSDPAAIASILRRSALAAYPRKSVAGLMGADWLAFLDQKIGGSDFSVGAGQELLVAPYRDNVAASDALKQLAERWIREHRTDPSP